MLRVVEDFNDNYKIYFAWNDCMDEAERWGALLAKVAHAIAADCGDCLEPSNPRDSVLTAIGKGFIATLCKSQCD